MAEKRVDVAYSDDGTRWTLTRLADLAGTKFVAETDQVFDELGRVGAITHGRAGHGVRRLRFQRGTPPDG